MSRARAAAETEITGAETSRAGQRCNLDPVNVGSGRCPVVGLRDMEPLISRYCVRSAAVGVAIEDVVEAVISRGVGSVSGEYKDAIAVGFGGRAELRLNHDCFVGATIESYAPPINPGVPAKLGRGIKRGCVRNPQVLVGAVQVERLTHFSRPEARTIIRGCIISADDVTRVTICRPPTNHTVRP